jgi:DNA-directed RNA polymerase subunit RPC12/RpoP
MNEKQTPYFCADCDGKLGHGAKRMPDGRMVCPRCAEKAAEKRQEKQQQRLFDVQSELFENHAGARLRNVEMGFFSGGVFHPIRASKDYNEFLAGDFDSKKEREARRLKRDAERVREYYTTEQRRLAKKFAQKHKSLSQFVRSSGGIAYKAKVKGSKGDDLRSKRGYASELGMLSPKETGTTGLLNKHNKQGSGRYGPEWMMDAANAEGYRDARGRKV